MMSRKGTGSKHQGKGARGSFGKGKGATGFQRFGNRGQFFTGGRKRRGAALQTKLYPKQRVQRPVTVYQTSDTWPSHKYEGLMQIVATSRGCANAQVIHHAQQIKAPSTLRAGRVIMRVSERSEFRYLEVVLYDVRADDHWFISFDPKSGKIGKHSIADYGIIPYDGGAWNPSLYLIDTGTVIDADSVERLRLGQPVELPEIDPAAY